MKLNKRETDILDFAIGKKTTSKELQAALSIKKSNLSGYLKKLGKLRLITIAKKGRDSVISIDPVISFGFPRTGSIRLSDILVGSTPFLLSFLKTKPSFRISDIDLPEATAKRLLKKTRGLGLVFMGSKGRYELREDAYALADFSRRVLMHMYLAEAEAELDITGSFFSFNSARSLEAVFISNREIISKRYWPTAYSAFAEYGIRLILAGKYYYANIHPGLTDIVIHTLAISKDSRSIAYVCALMLKNGLDPQRLLEKTQRFGLSEDFINDITGFMRSKARPGFPSWDEAERIAYV